MENSPCPAPRSASYIDLINAFWRLDDIYYFAANDTRLYFCLLNIANKLFWPQSIEVDNGRLCAHTGLSIDALRTARTRLKEAGLIGFASGGNGYGKKTRYEILAPKPNPNPHPKADPVLYKKNKTTYNSKNEQKTFLISGSDFD